jgi:hypothetical protein
MKAKTRTGRYEAFKDYTLAVARGERRVGPRTPKIWIERRASRKLRAKLGKVLRVPPDFLE